MITHLLFDFARVLWLPKVEITSRLSDWYARQENKDQSQVELNQQVLDWIKAHRQRYVMAIFTNSNSTLAEGSELRTEVEPYFDHILLAKQVGWGKDQPDTYLAVAKQLATQPEQILFIDDQLANIVAAQQAQIATIHFSDTTSCLSELNHYLALPKSSSATS